MANGDQHRNLVESANFWLLAAAALGVIGVFAVGLTASKVGDTKVTPVTLAFFALGCFVLLTAICSLFWGLVLFVADRRPVSPPYRPPAPTTLEVAPRPAIAKEPGAIPTNHHSTVQELDAKRLIALFANHTDYQAQELLKPWIGLEVQLGGSVTYVDKDGSVSSSQEGVTIFLYFRDESTERLPRLNHGDPIEIAGRIEAVSRNGWIRLGECRFLDE